MPRIGTLHALVSAKTEEDIEAKDELREFLIETADDALFRARLSRTPSNAEKEGGPSRRGLLEELRALAQAFPCDAVVRKWLTYGLGNAVAFAAAKGDFAQADALLGELRELASAFPDDAPVREVIAHLGRA